jgi:hypothetical protein
MEFIIGYPAQQADQSDRFPCVDIPGAQFGIDCFGLYFFEAGGRALDQPQNRFVWKTDAYNGIPAGVLDAVKANVVDRNRQPSAARPDLEWTINDFNGLRRLAGFPEVDLTAKKGWTMNVIAFAGSFQDDGVGEDFLPNNGDFVEVRFPCQAYDQCDVCGGDDSTCLDCARIPNGPNRYDACDVCGGNGSTCLDCRRIPNGPNRYDVCDGW